MNECINDFLSNSCNDGLNNFCGNNSNGVGFSDGCDGDFGGDGGGF
jgi:hypothetical protein